MKILLAVDKSAASDKAVAFVGDLLSGRRSDDVSITLLHIVESMPDYLLYEGSKGRSREIYEQLVHEWEVSRRQVGQKLLDEQQQRLVESGVPVDGIETKLVEKESRPESKKVVAALSLIEEMNRGDYSVVALGRRGSTAAEGSFLGSVAEKVLREAAGRTVWVID